MESHSLDRGHWTASRRFHQRPGSLVLRQVRLGQHRPCKERGTVYIHYTVNPCALSFISVLAVYQDLSQRYNHVFISYDRRSFCQVAAWTFTVLANISLARLRSAWLGSARLELARRPNFLVKQKGIAFLIVCELP